MSVKMIAILHCSLDAEDTFEQELKKLVETSKTEAGCLKYELYQYNNERCQYLIIDEWQDEEAHKKHEAAPHYRQFMRIAPVLLAKPAEIKKLVRLV